MDILKIIAELHAERAAIDEALVKSTTRNSGNPTRAFSPETRKRMAEAQKRRWAAYRRAKDA